MINYLIIHNLKINLSNLIYIYIMEKSIANKFKNMFFDIFQFMVLTFSTLRGLAVVSFCSFIYFLYFYLRGFIAYWGLIIAILAIVAFLILSWFIWFKNSDYSDD
jgi:hypothetical protein